MTILGKQTAEIICFVDRYIQHHLNDINHPRHLVVLEYFARAEAAKLKTKTS